METILAQSALHAETMLGECLQWSAQQRCLYFVDILDASIHAFDPADGRHWRIPVAEQIGCYGLRVDGGFIAAMVSGIYLLAADGKIEEKVAMNPSGKTHSRFNDGRVDPWGNFWCGTLWQEDDAAKAHLCRVSGSLAFEVIRGELNNTNGIAFAPDRSAMLFSDTSAHRIFRYPLEPRTGEIAGDDAVFFDFTTLPESHPCHRGKPDGGAFDREGNYWCALYGKGLIACISADKEIIRLVRVPVMQPTMPAFAGEKLDTLYITTSREKMTEAQLQRFPAAGDLFRAQPGVTGCEEPLFVVGRKADEKGEQSRR